MSEEPQKPVRAPYCHTWLQMSYRVKTNKSSQVDSTEINHSHISVAMLIANVLVIELSYGMYLWSIL